MRTEQLLREALTELADRPHPTEALQQRILVRTSPRQVRRRRVALALAVAAVLALVLAVPSVLSRRTAEPADVRVDGNWNMIHRVDVPAGWKIATQIVTADAESTNLRAPAGAGTVGCVVEILGPGQPDPNAHARHRDPVEVDGKPGFYSFPDSTSTDPSQLTDGGVTWRYSADAWAQVSCGAGRTLDLEIANRVRFEVVPIPLPFRLRSLPTGYHVRGVAPAVLTADPPMLGAVQLATVDKSADPTLSIMMSSGTTEVPAGLPGWETATIDGTPAVLSARDGRLCLNSTGHTLCIDSGEGTPADLTTSLWPAGRRELLVEVAEDLVVAKNLDDPRTWYDADRTLPTN